MIAFLIPSCLGHSGEELLTDQQLVVSWICWKELADPNILCGSVGNIW